MPEQQIETLIMKALTNYLVDGYFEDVRVKERIDNTIEARAPEEIKRKGIIDKVEWLLRDSEGVEAIRAYLKRKEA